MLLHTCCAPCLTYPLTILKQEFAVTSYFFNPNIHPYKEFIRRLQTLREYSQKQKLKLIVDKTYNLEEFLLNCLQIQPVRCVHCYQVRMLKVAEYAKMLGYDCFSTTLLVSPFQKHELLKDICQQVANQVGIEFYYQDFRPGFEIGKQLSLEAQLYRQAYCGCIFSERDRYEKKK